MWILTSERMPEKCKRVVIIAKPIMDNAKQFVDVAWFDAGIWWLDANHALSRAHYKVEHWTELPELPAQDLT